MLMRLIAVAVNVRMQGWWLDLKFQFRSGSQLEKKILNIKKNDLSLVIKIFFLNCNRGVFGILVTFPHKK